MTKYIRKKLAERLIEAGLITAEQFDIALKKHQEIKIPIRQILIDSGYIKEDVLVKFIADVLEIKYIENLPKKIDDIELQNLFTEEFCREKFVLPLYKWEDYLTVAMADPFDVFTIDDIRSIAKCKIKTIITKKDEIIKSIDSCYGKKDLLKDIFNDVQQEFTDLEVIKSNAEELQSTQKSSQEIPIDDEGPIIRLVNSMIKQAIDENASDIHIETDEESLRIRFRIDGVLEDAMRPPKNFQPYIVSRIKIMAGMDISIKMTPQDGRFGIKNKNSDIDVRVSTIPTVFGEKVVLRLLNQKNINLILEELGFSEHDLTIFKKTIRLPHGIILISGPTGSGKTTTLYVVLQNINSPGKNIITIEDPVEYQLKGINQIQVNTKAGVTFAKGLRSILRQDPDIIMVGEMRDLETAETSVQAALTGHLVFSTLHTNDSASSIVRMVDMGVPSYLVAASVYAVVSQRLVRVLCPKCKVPYEPEQSLLDEIKLKGKPSDYTFYHKKGCDYCNKHGFKGRTIIVELMIIDKMLRKMIHEKSSSDEIRAVAQNNGMKLLWEDGIEKVKSGITTIEEARKASFVDND